MMGRWTPFAVPCLLVACCFGSASAAPTDPRPLSYEVQIAGVGTLSNLRYVMLPGLQFTLVKGAVGTANADVRRIGAGQLAEVEVEVQPSSLWMFANMVTHYSSGTSDAGPNVQVHTINGNPQRGAWTDLGSCILTSTEFPALDATDYSGQQVFVQMKLQPELSSVMDAPKALPAGPTAPPSIAQPQSPLTMTALNFAVSISGMDASGVVKIEPIKIVTKVGSEVLGVTRVRQLRAAGAENESFTMMVRGTTAWAFQAWMDANIAGTPTTRDVTIQFMNRGNTATLFTLRGVNVGLASLRAQRPTDGNAQLYAANLFVERWILTGPEAKAEKLNGIVPATLPLQPFPKK